MPGVRFKLWLRYRIRKFPWVQVPANEIGVVIAQIGKTLPPGAKSARYHDVFGNFTDLDAFVNNNGEKGVQRPVLAPGTLLPIHPVAFFGNYQKPGFWIAYLSRTSEASGGREIDPRFL